MKLLKGLIINTPSSEKLAITLLIIITLIGFTMGTHYQKELDFNNQSLMQSLTSIPKARPFMSPTLTLSPTQTPTPSLTPSPTLIPLPTTTAWTNFSNHTFSLSYPASWKEVYNPGESGPNIQDLILYSSDYADSPSGLGIGSGVEVLLYINNQDWQMTKDTEGVVSTETISWLGTNANLYHYEYDANDYALETTYQNNSIHMIFRVPSDAVWNANRDLLLRVANTFQLIK